MPFQLVCAGLHTHTCERDHNTTASECSLFPPRKSPIGLGEGDSSVRRVSQMVGHVCRVLSFGGCPQLSRPQWLVTPLDDARFLEVLSQGSIAGLTTAAFGVSFALTNGGSRITFPESNPGAPIMPPPGRPPLRRHPNLRCHPNLRVASVLLLTVPRSTLPPVTLRSQASVRCERTRSPRPPRATVLQPTKILL